MLGWRHAEPSRAAPRRDRDPSSRHPSRAFEFVPSEAFFGLARRRATETVVNADGWSRNYPSLFINIWLSSGRGCSIHRAWRRHSSCGKRKGKSAERWRVYARIPHEHTRARSAVRVFLLLTPRGFVWRAWQWWLLSRPTRDEITFRDYRRLEIEERFCFPPRM